MFFSGCSNKYTFTKKENGNIISVSGVEYELASHQGNLHHWGETEFVGYIEGEKRKSKLYNQRYNTGMFAFKDDDNDNILVRRPPNSEWIKIYRKTSLPEFDFIVDNCVRLEFLPHSQANEFLGAHATCGDGMADKEEIEKFITDIRSQENPREAGLYDLIEKPDGMLENCYVYGVVLGTFAEEPNSYIKMQITG